MTFERVVIAGSGLVFLAIGVAFVFFPAPLAGVVDIELTSVTAHNDFRAVYGGVCLGLAVFLAMALARPAWEEAALWVVVLTLGGLAATRFWSWLADGWPGPIALLLHAMEFGGCVLALVALRHGPRDEPA